jgi:hypothetical protein
MFWTKFSGFATATLLIAAVVVPAAPAYADDCGDFGQPSCTGPVPTIDEVVAVMAELTDPGIPAAPQTNVVTPGFAPEEAQTIDDHLNRMNGDGLLPLNFVVTNIQPAPANLAGATTATAGTLHQSSAARPIVLVNQGGHWLITHDTAMTEMDAFWYNADRYVCRFPKFPVYCPGRLTGT